MSGLFHRATKRLGGAALLVSMLVGACEGGHGSSTASTSVAGPRVAPTLAGKTIDGAAFELASLHGTVVLVNVWATWCAPCRDELPELKALHERHAERGFTVVGVSTDRAGALLQVKQMVDAYGLPYPIVFDPDGRATAGWDIRGYPTSLLVDRSGNIRWRRDGLIRPDDPELAAHLKVALEAP